MAFKYPRLFCFFIVAAYVPQYIAIVRHGTHGIASRYILFHSLFSVFTLALRVCHPMFYNAFNCVNGGPYTGWKALSSLLGILQAIVQWLAAMVQLGLYVHYRSDEAGAGPEAAAAAAAETEAIAGGVPATSSRAMQIAVGVTAAVVLSVSFAFIFFNEYPLFDQDEWMSGSYWFPVYVLALGFWRLLLLLPNTVFLFLPAVYQIKIVRAPGGDHGALSLVSLAMQAVVFVVLGILQAARSWRSVMWFNRDDFWPPTRFLECFLTFYGTVQTHVSYAVTGVGFLVVLVVCLLEERRRNAEGRIQV